MSQNFNLVTKVHVTGTSALDITVARTPQIPVMDILVHFCDIYIRVLSCTRSQFPFYHYWNGS